MIFPIGDTQVKGPYKPYVSYSLIALNIFIFILQMTTEGNLICEYSTIPGNILIGQDYFTLLSSMFLHGGYMHILGNMVFLWIFGDNIEIKIGNWQFLGFYLLGGLVSSWAHIYFNIPTGDLSDCCMPCSEINCADATAACKGYIPSLGASGAISAVMGAYLVMFPKSKVKLLVLIFFRSFYIPAFLFLGFWFVQQLFSGVGESFSELSGTTSGTAWWAHIGGFVFGLALGLYFKNRIKPMKSNDDLYV
jgi:membrane associated rhomboid family serine protease